MRRLFHITLLFLAIATVITNAQEQRKGPPPANSQQDTTSQQTQQSADNSGPSAPAAQQSSSDPNTGQTQKPAGDPATTAPQVQQPADPEQADPMGNPDAQAAEELDRQGSAAVSDRADLPETDRSPKPSDEELHGAVQQKLAGSEFKWVRVAVQKGKVTLTGTVGNKEARKRAKKLAQSVRGVRGVRDNLKVDANAAASLPNQPANASAAPAGTGAGTPSAVGEAQDAAAAQNQSAAAPGANETRSRQRTASQQAPQSQPDLRKERWESQPGFVTGPASADLDRMIENALRNDPSLRGSSINVEVSDMEIEVSGQTPTGKEREVARRIVQSYAGNRRVSDKLSVLGKAESTAASQSPSGAGQSGSSAPGNDTSTALPESDQLPAKQNQPAKKPEAQGDRGKRPR